MTSRLVQNWNLESERSATYTQPQRYSKTNPVTKLTRELWNCKRLKRGKNFYNRRTKVTTMKISGVLDLL